MTSEELTRLVAECDRILSMDAPDLGQMYLKDLAALRRCAAAWAKVEELLKKQKMGWTIGIWRTIDGRVAIGHNDKIATTDTAIEAVEAAR